MTYFTIDNDIAKKYKCCFQSNHLFCFLSTINQQTTCQIDSYKVPNSKLKSYLHNCVKTEVIESTAPPQQSYKRGKKIFGKPCSYLPYEYSWNLDCLLWNLKHKTKTDSFCYLQLNNHFEFRKYQRSHLFVLLALKYQNPYLCA